ncbi:MAG: DUF2478 domain-containing protein [Rhizobiaceae bacterium]
MTSPLAIVQTKKDQNIDLIIAAAAEQLKRQDKQIAGFLQRERDIGSSACCSDMYLEDLGSGAQFTITQRLGPGSSGCRLDPQGLVEAVSYLSSQINDQVDMLFLNRFGKGEEEGRGFRPVIEEAYALNIPTLIVVRETYMDAWRQFCGDDYTHLPANKDAIIDWYQQLSAGVELAESA